MVYFQSSHLLDNKPKLKDRSPTSQNPRREAVGSLQDFISKLFPMLTSTFPTGQRQGGHPCFSPRNQSKARSTLKASRQKVLPDQINIPFFFPPEESGMI